MVPLQTPLQGAHTLVLPAASSALACAVCAAELTFCCASLASSETFSVTPDVFPCVRVGRKCHSYS